MREGTENHREGAGLELGCSWGKVKLRKSIACIPVLTERVTLRFDCDEECSNGSKKLTVDITTGLLSGQSMGD